MTRHIMRNKILTILLLASGILFACKSTKTTEPGQKTLEKANKEERLNRMIQAGLHYDTFSSDLKFTLTLPDNNQDIPLDAQLHIKKNEAIQLSFRYSIFGISSELLKATITPSEIIIIDRINKQYLRESIVELKKKIPFEFDYYSLEALLSNRLFIAGKKEIQEKDYESFGILENEYLVRISNIDQQNIQYDFISDYTDRIQQTQMSQAKWKSQLLCHYTDWGLTSDKKDFPMSMKFSLDIPEKSYRIQLAFHSVDINSGLTIDRNIPAKYKPVTLQRVINLIKKLL